MSDSHPVQHRFGWHSDSSDCAEPDLTHSEQDVDADEEDYKWEMPEEEDKERDVDARCFPTITSTFIRPSLTPSLQQRVRFGSRLITVSTTWADDHHNHVLRARLQLSTVEKVIVGLLALVPLCLQGWLKATFPEWFLPPVVILKQKKEGWDDEFENEKKIYDRLRPLFGTVVPVYFGQGQWRGKETLILSDVGGHSMCDPAVYTLKPDHVKSLFKEAFDALAEYGVIHDDNKLDNYHLVDGKIVVLDMEWAEEIDPKHLEYTNRCSVNHLMRGFQDNLEYLKHEGKI